MTTMRAASRGISAFVGTLIGPGRRKDPRHVVAEKLQELYEEESWEVGAALARAAKAHEDGEHEAATLLEAMAQDEARHLALVVRLLYPQHVERSAEANLRATCEGDQGAVERARALATTARAAGLAREAALFDSLAADELAHAEQLDAAVRRLCRSSR